MIAALNGKGMQISCVLRLGYAIVRGSHGINLTDLGRWFGVFLVSRWHMQNELIWIRVSTLHFLMRWAFANVKSCRNIGLCYILRCSLQWLSDDRGWSPSSPCCSFCSLRWEERGVCKRLVHCDFGRRSWCDLIWHIQNPHFPQNVLWLSRELRPSDYFGL